MQSWSLRIMNGSSSVRILWSCVHLVTTSLGGLEDRTRKEARRPEAEKNFRPTAAQQRTGGEVSSVARLSLSRGSLCYFINNEVRQLYHHVRVTTRRRYSRVQILAKEFRCAMCCTMCCCCARNDQTFRALIPS